MRARLLRAAALVPQLRRRVYLDPAHLAAPRWIDDPDFAIERHVTARTLAPHGDLDAVIATAMEFNARPFDPDHPLWEFQLLDGLDDGRGVMLQRLHHTISDGVGMVRISEQFVDLERTAAEPEPVPLPVAEPIPSAVGGSREALGHTIRRTAESVRTGVTSTIEAVREPQRLESSARRALALARALVVEAALPRRSRSPLWNDRSDRRTLRLLRVPFDDVRTFAKSAGVTVNDVFVAATAGGAGDYHRRMGHDVDELRMAMPVNTREDRSAAGNAFGTARIMVSDHRRSDRAAQPDPRNPRHGAR